MCEVDATVQNDAGKIFLAKYESTNVGKLEDVLQEIFPKS